MFSSCIKLATLHQSKKSKCFTPTIECFSKRGIMIFFISENFETFIFSINSLVIRALGFPRYLVPIHRFLALWKKPQNTEKKAKASVALGFFYIYNYNLIYN